MYLISRHTLEGNVIVVWGYGDIREEEEEYFDLLRRADLLLAGKIYSIGQPPLAVLLASS